MGEGRGEGEKARGRDRFFALADHLLLEVSKLAELKNGLLVQEVLLAQRLGPNLPKRVHVAPGHRVSRPRGTGSAGRGAQGQ